MSQKIELILDSMQLSSFEDCEHYYSLSFVEHLIPRKEKRALGRGKTVHDMLHLFYKAKIRKHNFKSCVNYGLRYLKWLQKNKIQMPGEDYAIILQKFLEYCSYYRSETWKPLYTEGSFSKLIYEDLRHRFIYEGRIDLVIRPDSSPSVAWVDHKTESRKEELNQNSNQFLGYSWALGTKGGIVNYVGLQESYKPVDSFRRQIINHRPDLIKEWQEYTISWFFRILRDRIDNYYPKNRTSCKKYACPPCHFHEVCNQTHPSVVKTLKERDFEKREEPWRAWY